MKMYKGKHNDDLFSLIDNNDSLGESNSLNSFQNHGALTPEEVLGQNSFTPANAEPTGALEALKKRMLAAQQEEAEKAKQEPVKPAEVKAAEEPKTRPEPPKAPEVPEINTSVSSDSLFDFDFFDNTKPEPEKAAENPVIPEKPAAPKKPEKSLLEKCRPFILDDEGHDSAMKETPTYKLESVADILNNQSAKTLDRLSEKYEIEFDDLGRNKPAAPEKVPEPPKREVFEEKMPAARDIQTNVPRIISDIDSDSGESAVEMPDISGTATIKFTPVTDSDSTSRISISSQTRSIDLTGELSRLPESTDDDADPETRLEQNEFEDYKPAEEFEDESGTKHFLRKLSLIKRGSFLRCVSTVLLTLITAFAELPFMSALLIAQTKVSMTVYTAVLGIIILINLDMFKSVPKIFSRFSTPDIFAVTASLSVMLYSVIGILKNEITLNMLLLAAFILSVRSVAAFFRAAHTLTGLRQIAGNKPKRAVKLINDPAVTFAMAKNSIEGDVLAAAPRRTAHIDDYMKYTSFRVYFSGKLPVITVVSLLLSVILGFACAAYFDGMLYGFYSAAVVQCIAAVPVLFLIDDMPLYSASKKLARRGAEIAGKMGAEYLEKVNAIVLSSEDLFPSGTVTLHNMQLLSDNSIDDTIMRAASLTDSLSSPLAPIFKKIAGTVGDFVMPDSDTVKYEDKMGVSGWVNNKLLFVGNRTLMEAHGIDVPSIETDRKLLRRGYFPVYVATDDKACALLAVQYTVKPELAREFRRISAMGITMLIDSSDPNLTEEMICDYMGLYDDSVKVMSTAGCHMYKNAVTYTEHCSAPAAYKGNPVALAALVSSAVKIKKSSLLLAVFYALSCVAGVVMFTYTSFSGSGSVLGSAAVLLYCLISTAVSATLYLTGKP